MVLLVLSGEIAFVMLSCYRAERRSYRMTPRPV